VELYARLNSGTVSTVDVGRVSLPAGTRFGVALSRGISTTYNWRPNDMVPGAAGKSVLAFATLGLSLTIEGNPAFYPVGYGLDVETAGKVTLDG
jgi:hypothetical protein